jgi:hypothetical protein
VVRLAEKRFVFEIMRDNRSVASGDEHKTAKGGKADLEAEGQI